MRGNGRNHNFVIQTRQKVDELFTLVSDIEAPVAAGTPVAFPARKVEGYARVLFFAVGSAPFSIEVLQGTTATGTFVQTTTLTSVAGPGGEQIISASIEPTGSYMKINLISATDQPIGLKVLGRPV